MRVLAVSNLYPPDVVGGYEVSCMQAVEALRRRGHEVVVLTSVARTPVPRDPGVLRRLRLVEMWDDAYTRAVPRVVVDSDRIAATLVDRDNVAHLLDAIAQTVPDVVYFWNTYGVGGAGLAVAARLLGVPWVWHLGDYVPAYLCTAAGDDARQLGALFGEHLDGTWICCSDTVVRGLARAGVALRGDVRRIPMWYAGDASPLRREWMAGGVLRCAVAGRLVEAKGIGLVLDALQRLHDGGERRWSLDVYGEPVEPWRSAARAGGMDGSVRFHGQVDHESLVARLADHDVLIAPTHPDEPFGMVVLEAAAQGCVPVVPPDFGAAEWVVDGVDCLTAARDAGAVASVLRSILHGDVDVAAVGARAANVARTRFHLDRAAAQIEGALLDAAAHPAAPSATPDDVHRLARLAEGLAVGALAR